MQILNKDKFNPYKSIKLFGYNNYFLSMSELYKNNKFPKILMLSGEKGYGKFTFAFHLVNYFLSNTKFYDVNNFEINPESDFYQKIMSNINENFNYIGRIGDKKVGVEEIRDLKKNFYKSSLNNLPRFTILDDADLLNQNSANALLKLIEEPTNINYFILINNKREKILDTLKSRSLEFKIFFNQTDRNEILKNLKNKFEISLDTFLDYSSHTTPGNFIRVSDCLLNNNILNIENMNNKIEILLDKFKKDKKNIYVETIKFLLNIQMIKIMNKGDHNFIKLVFLKKKIEKLISEYEKFGLSKNSILDSFKVLPNYV